MIIRDEYLNKILKYKDKKIIKVLTGMRRSGKSTIIKMIEENLLQNGIESKQIIMMNFDNIENEPYLEYHKLYDYILNNLNTDKMNYIFLDEIQNVKNFEKSINSLLLKDNVDIYITGSNSYMMSGELATYLTGRYIEIEILPLSFKEYLSFVGNKGNNQENFRDYLRFGALPYISYLNKDLEQIENYYRGIYSTVLLKDVVSRNKITDIPLLESIVRFIFDNIGNIVSTKKISDTLTSNGRKTNPTTVENYIKYLEDAYLIYKVKRYDIKGKEYLKTLEKYYVSDIGFRNAILGYRDTDYGHILENVVHLELRRRGFKINSGKVGDNEIDFIASKANDLIYYQVSDTVIDKNTLNRELKPFELTNDHYEKILITADFDVATSYNGIKKINIIDFLLQ